MKKRWILIAAISALLVSLCSCTTAHRATRRFDAVPAPVTAPRNQNTQKPERPRTNVAPRNQLPPRTHPLPAAPRNVQTTPFNGMNGGTRNENNRDGARNEETRRDGVRHDGVRRDTVHDGAREGIYRADRDGLVEGQGTHRTTRDEGTHRVARDRTHHSAREGYSRNSAGNSVAPRRSTAPPVRSLPRANRIPATRIPVQ
jgi:hypothetical protein